MKVGRGKFGEDTVNPFWYSIEECRPFILSAIQSKEECCIMMKCYAEIHVREIRVFLFCYNGGATRYCEILQCIWSIDTCFRQKQVFRFSLKKMEFALWNFLTVDPLHYCKKWYDWGLHFLSLVLLILFVSVLFLSCLFSLFRRCLVASKTDTH